MLADTAGTSVGERGGREPVVHRLEHVPGHRERDARSRRWMSRLGPVFFAVVAACNLEGAEDVSAKVESRLLAEISNLIVNPSFETSNATTPSQPAGWRGSVWGSNAVSFAYDNTGHTGARSVRVAVTSYASGDAKWAFTPVAAGSGWYVYRDYYQSSVPTKVVAASQLSDGTIKYQTLGVVAAASTWTKAAFAFAAPAGTASVAVYHLIAATGTLQIDDVMLGAVSAPDLSSGVPDGTLEQGADLDLDHPLGWQTSSWGANQAAFAYTRNGRNGTRGVELTISQYTSGDAKWFFEPQSVTAGTRYLFSDYYQSSAPSFLIAQFTLASGALKYITVATLPSVANYTQAQVAFTAPAGAVAATMFHGLAQIGTLRFDDVTLTSLPSITLVNGVPNGDLEQESFPGAKMPAGWLTNRWGDNTAVLSYANSGHSGSRSVRTEVTEYRTGSLGWYFDPQPVVGGQAYRMTEYYQSNVDAVVLALIGLADGTTTQIRLPVAFASSSWAPYSAKVYLPKNAASLTFLHVLTGVGYVQVDDVTFTQAPGLPFSRGLVSLTFDDSYETDYTNVLPVLRQSGAVATHYTLAGFLGTPGRLTVEMLTALQQAGDEIASHTVNHGDLTTLSPDDLAYELATSRSFLEARGLGPVVGFASPFGSYNRAVLTAITGQYQSHRTVDVGYNSADDFDIYRLKVQTIQATTTIAEVEAWAAQAAASRSWLILVYHAVADPPPDVYDTTPANLSAHLAAVARKGLPVLTVRDALAEIVPQLPTHPQ